MGLPIMVQLTEAERNKTHAGDGYAIQFILPFASWLIFITEVSIYHQASVRLMEQCDGFTISHSSLY